MMTGRPLTIPQCPCHCLYMAWVFRLFAILRTPLSWAANEISKVGGATMTGRPLTIHNAHGMGTTLCGMGILLIRYPAWTSVLGL